MPFVGDMPVRSKVGHPNTRVKSFDQLASGTLRTLLPFIRERVIYTLVRVYQTHAIGCHARHESIGSRARRVLMQPRPARQTASN